MLFEFLGVFSLFDLFGNIDNWTLKQSLLLYGIVNFSFSFVEMFFRGFESDIQDLLRRGEYDRYLLRPYSPLLQISAFGFQPMRFGRMIVAILVLLYAAISNFEVSNALYILLYLPFVLVCGCCLYSGIYILVGSITFLANQYIEFTSIFVQGSVSLMQYPRGIFPKVIQNFFTYILPVSLISYFPVSVILNKDLVGNKLLLMLSPLAGILFLFISIMVFKRLEESYSSSGN